MFEDTGQAVEVRKDSGLTNPSMTERLHRLRKSLESKLEKVNEAISALESNPEVARTVDAISKLGHF